jgi:PilZ domain
MLAGERPMLEGRKSERQLTFRTGTITAAGDPNRIACAILNISSTGACILVPRRAEIRELFELAIDRDDAVRRCRRVWRQGSRIGVAFLDAESRPRE